MKGNKGKKLFSCMAILLFIFPSLVTAHFGGKDKDGGHTCKSNCEDYGLEYGQYHKHKPGTFEVLPDLPKQVPIDPDTPFFSWNKFLWTGVFSIVLSMFCFACCLLNRCVNRSSEWLVSLLRRLIRFPDKK